MRYALLFLYLLISVYAFGQNRQGQDRALFFAVNDYQKMADLKNPIKNARDLAAELEKRYGFLAEVIPNPTLSVIEEKIASYKQQYASGRYAKGGQLLVFFTGHGIMKGNNGYFMPADADPNRPYASAIEYGYWRNEINDIDCKHTLVAIDACHSITFDPNWKNKPDRNFSRPGEKFSDQVLLNHQSYRARLFFTSDAVGNQTPDRSTFAQQLLTGLRTHSSTTGYLTSSELFASYLKKAAPTPGGGSFGNDEPGSAFLFFRNIQRQFNDKQYTQRQQDIDAYKAVQSQPTIVACQRYLRDFLTGEFRTEVYNLLLQLQEEQEWELASLKNTKASYQVYLNRYPSGAYANEVLIKLGKIEQEKQNTIRREAAIPPPSTPERDNMVFVKGGSFEMGSKEGSSNETPHKVTLSNYYMSRYEVTFEEYDAFCAATDREEPDDEGWGRQKRPVVNVNWYDAIEYCNWLSQKEGLQTVYTIDKSKKDPNNTHINGYDKLRWLVAINWNANGYRLPTEAEWEYAARSRGENQKWAGTSTQSKLNTFANGLGGGNKHTSSVGTFKANDLGLFDMSGNVWELCWDWYDTEYYSKSINTNPKGSDTGAFRVRRGGSWFGEPADLRCAYRSYHIPDNRYERLGFRLSRAAP